MRLIATATGVSWRAGIPAKLASLPSSVLEGFPYERNHGAGGTLMRDHPAAYQASKGAALAIDRDFYRRVAESGEARKLVEQFVIPIRTGRAWIVPSGHVFRIVAVEGPQVGDLNIWNRHNPRERLWASRTRQLQGAHVSTFDRLWSTLPICAL